VTLKSETLPLCNFISIQEYASRLEQLNVETRLGWHNIELHMAQSYRDEKDLEKAIARTLIGSRTQIPVPGGGKVDIGYRSFLFEVKLYLDGGNFNAALKQLWGYVYRFGQSSYLGVLIGQARYRNLEYLKKQSGFAVSEFGIETVIWWNGQLANSLRELT